MNGVDAKPVAVEAAETGAVVLRATAMYQSCPRSSEKESGLLCPKHLTKGAESYEGALVHPTAGYCL